MQKRAFYASFASVIFRLEGRSERAAAALLLAVFTISAGGFASAAPAESPRFPPALNSYAQAQGGLIETLRDRVVIEPFNLIATTIFFLAIIHTFLAPVFMKLSHRFEREHRERLSGRAGTVRSHNSDGEVSFKAEVFHLLGEVEAIFGIWVVPLLFMLGWRKDLHTARNYLSGEVNYTEPLFVVVIMAIAASRPILKLSERIMALAAGAGKGSPAAWWLSILSVGPVLGSFITEPAAMTISAMLLADKIYKYQPSKLLAYGTLGLLFVNISVGGTLTHFAAPPVLMVAGKWGWGFQHMLTEFGWKAMLGICLANTIYFLVFRRELRALGGKALKDSGYVAEDMNGVPVPAWITVVHVMFLAWTVINNHYPVLFIGGFLFYVAFTEATKHHQANLALRPAMLVGFFLAGLVVHGGLQGWWIEPVLSRLSELPLFFGAVGLTAFNDNAAITYLASLVPGFTPELKYAVVAGAVAGGGLTVIANAPNPAGQSILGRFFENGVSAFYLFLGALLPTAVMAIAFLVFR